MLFGYGRFRRGWTQTESTVDTKKLCKYTCFDCVCFHWFSSSKFMFLCTDVLRHDQQPRLPSASCGAGLNTLYTLYYLTDILHNVILTEMNEKCSLTS